jgi:hypothetical protein
MQRPSSDTDKGAFTALLATLANERGCSDEMQTRPMALEASSFASSKKAVSGGEYLD